MTDGEPHDLSECRFQAGNQTERTMTDVFELSSFHQPWFHLQRGMEPLQRLNACHFIQRNDVNAARMQQRSHVIQPTDLLRFPSKEGRILRLGIQSAFRAVRTQIRLMESGKKPDGTGFMRFRVLSFSSIPLLPAIQNSRGKTGVDTCFSLGS